MYRKQIRCFSLDVQVLKNIFEVDQNTHLWRVIGVKTSPGALWSWGRAERRVQRHLRDERFLYGQRLSVQSGPVWSGRDCWRVHGREVDGTGQRRSPRKALQPPVGCRQCFLRLVVTWPLKPFSQVSGGRQVPHSERKLCVFLVLDGQTGQLNEKQKKKKRYTLYLMDYNLSLKFSLLVNLKSEEGLLPKKICPEPQKLLKTLNRNSSQVLFN